MAHEQAVSGAMTFELSRRLAAPRDRVWAAFSDGSQLGQWWGPKGCAVEALAADFRPGGMFHYSMRFPGAAPMWGRFAYRIIEAPHRLVWLNSFATKGCGIARAPFSELCPLEIENALTFAEQDGSTLVKLRATPFGASDEEIAYFVELHASLEEGYGGTFDQLAEFLGGR